MSFYDILSPFVGHDIIVDNAKRYPSIILNCVSNNNPIESIPPLEKYCYVTDRRMKRKSKRQQQQQTLTQDHEQKEHISPLSLASHNDSLIITKHRNYWSNNSNKTLLIPAKKFHDEDATSKRNKHDKTPKAPIRWTTTTARENATNPPICRLR